MRNKRYIKMPKKPRICVCGHSHWATTGSDFEGNESLKYEELIMCCECDCEDLR